MVDIATKEEKMKTSIGRLISKLHRKSQVYINYALNDYNITSAEYAFLLCLFRKDGKTQEELSSYLDIDKSATARAIKSLEEKGYVTKMKDDIDKRFNRIHLTDLAKQHQEDIRNRIFHWSEFLMEDVTEEDAAVLFRVLENMAGKIDKTNLKSLGDNT
jgi:DNA-binding MarR family transcriptional regulator